MAVLTDADGAPSWPVRSPCPCSSSRTRGPSSATWPPSSTGTSRPRPHACVGITGTNGKTTTAYLVESGLRALGETTGLIGTVETRVGDDPDQVSVRTTPEATDLHALFAVMRGARARPRASWRSRATPSPSTGSTASVFDVALFTNLSQDHLDFHGDMEDYFAAKALAVHARARAAAAWSASTTSGARGWLGRPGSRCVTVGSHLGSRADWAVASRGDWPAFTLTGPGGRRSS